jgi:hypothetical protein
MIGEGVPQPVECLTTDWTTEVWSPAEAKVLPLGCVQASSEAHPASYPMGIGGPYPEVKRGQGVTLTTLQPSIKVRK